MKKNTYITPSLEIINLLQQITLLVGSEEPILISGVPWWDGEGDAKRWGGWFGDEEDTEEAWSVIP